jgi:hypothetical protein
MKGGYSEELRLATEIMGRAMKYLSDNGFFDKQ